jgi:hypothetical protein
VGVTHPERPSLTGLTSVAHRFDRCRGLVGFATGECTSEFLVVPCCYCFESGSFWSLGDGFLELGFPGLDRPDR